MHPNDVHFCFHDASLFAQRALLSVDFAPQSARQARATHPPITPMRIARYGARRNAETTTRQPGALLNVKHEHEVGVSAWRIGSAAQAEIHRHRGAAPAVPLIVVPFADAAPSTTVRQNNGHPCAYQIDDRRRSGKTVLDLNDPAQHDRGVI